MQCISFGYWLSDFGVTFDSHVLRNSQRLAKCDGWVWINRAPSPFSPHFPHFPRARVQASVVQRKT